MARALINREWFRSLMEAAIGALRETLAADGKTVSFEVFQAYYLERQSDAESLYRGIAARLAIKETDVRNDLTHGRRVLERILRERIREYVASDAEVDAELMKVPRR